MHALTEAQIRACFVNSTRRERNSLTFPIGFDAIDWEKLLFLGWRDPKLPLVGYLVTPVDDEPVGVILRLGSSQPRTRPQCSLCEDVQLPNEVAFYSAKRGGAAGRKGDTLGALICSEFQCNANVRAKPSKIFAGADPEAVRQLRIEGLGRRVERFARRVAGSA
ncbi:FBP domain-containing protein [Gordonia sp. LSe1-13]|uniref:FBP domain-containing protein n=1 Tax=Gordonia sesuvii TaxID=3116777 RepID=A0ABU7M7F9_9ACTN|nr:FBP domain-containing protein [Gordonia sp. LSe1-13]